MADQYLKLRRSSVPGKVPTTASLDFGEVALNTYNGLAFLKMSGSVGQQVVQIGSIISGALNISGTIASPTYIDFIVDPGTVLHQEGRIHWDIDRKTLEVDTDVNNFMISTGHMSVLRGKNQNSYTLTKGTVIYINGNSGQFATFGTASWEDDPRSAYTIGVISQDIAPNNSGYAITSGELVNINTNAYPPATLLYLSSSGQFTDQKPIAPLHAVRLGQVVVQSINGILQVKVDNGYETDELHDVLLSTTSSYGDLLVRSGSLWINSKQLTGSYGLTGSLNISGSLNATASWATNALSASYAQTASFAPAYLPLTGGTINGNVTVNGTASISFLNVTYQSSSVIYSSGSNQFGDAPGDTQTLFGTVVIPTGSLTVSGSVNISGSLNATSSWATNALTASYISASGVVGLSLNRIVTGSVTASVGIGTASFQLTSGSSTLLFISNSGVLYASSAISIGSPTAELIPGRQTLVQFGNIGSGYSASIQANAGALEFIHSNSGTHITIAASNRTAFNQVVGIGNPNFGWTTTDRLMIRTQDTSSSSTGIWVGNGSTNNNIFKVYGDGTVSIGQTIAPGYALQISGSTSPSGSLNVNNTLLVSGSLVSVTGSLAISASLLTYSQNLSVATGSWQNIVASPTASYKAAFFDYVAFSGSIGRAGTVTTFWSASATEFYENYTEDLGGSTVGVVLQTAISASQIVLQATASSAAWTIRSLVRLL